MLCWRWPSANIVPAGWPRRPRPIAAFWPNDPTSPKCTTTSASCSGNKASSTRPWHNSSKPSPSNPAMPKRHNNLGRTRLNQGKLDEAAARFQQALALRPRYADAHNNLGNLLLSQGQLQPAAAHFEQTIALAPGNAEAHNNLGIILAQQGRLEPAAARFEQVLALRPDFAEAHYNLGNVLLSQGKSDQAVARFERALELKPDCVEAYNNLGNVLMQQGQLAEAAAHYQQALAFRPHYAEAINNLGTVLAATGPARPGPGALPASHRPAARLRRSPQQPGEHLWKQGEFDQAVAHLEQALARKPDWAEARINLGKVLGSQARLDDAEQCYRQALALRPDDAEAQFGLAMSYLVEGDYQRGWPAYEARLRVPGAMRLPNFPRWSGETLGRAQPACCWPSKAWAIRSSSSALPGC